MGDWIVMGVLCILVGSILYGMIKNKKQGKSACGCDCSKCGRCCGASGKDA